MSLLTNLGSRPAHFGALVGATLLGHGALSQKVMAQTQPEPPTTLEAGFRKPPASAKTQTWWHWLNGNVTKAGITADLEAMARAGVGGAEIFNVDQGIPAGPVRFMTPQWLEMMRFAASEADRLGIQLCMHNCAGWSSSGGPWNTPDYAMQFLTNSEVHVHGPAHFDEALAQPATKLNSYHDIAVLAFRTPYSEVNTMRAALPEVTTSILRVAGAPITVTSLVDGNPGTFVTLPAPTGGVDNWAQVAFPVPFRARTLRLQTGPGRNEGSVELSVSDDGQQFRHIANFGLRREERNPVLNFEPTAARYWRLAFNRRVNLAEIDLSAALRVENIEGKAAFTRADHPSGNTAMDAANGGTATGEGTKDAAIAKVLDISAKLQPDGHLTWDVPEGDWTILRFGHTPTGSTNEPGPPEATGPEVDKLSREAVDAHWNGAVAPVLKALGPLAGKSFNDVLIDSYEVGSENWTPRFREEFRARRGYDPVPWLPVTTGRVVDNPATSERFLWDLRRTVSDLFAENYAGRFAQLAHQNGLMFSAEPYGNGTFEDFQYGGNADIPMGEFWVGDSGSSSCKLAASVGHIYGRKFIGAESFTAVPEHARWTNDPYSLKALGDLIYCSGINRFIFHRYAMQPWTDKAPGMTMGPWGIHFERTETWWNQGASWLGYLSRCQYLLQQGLFVADIATFYGDDSPNTLQGPSGLPSGYDYDGINPEVLQKRLTVRDGRLTLPDGMSYRVLTLPDTDAMTPATLRRLSALVRSGAVIMGPRPTHSPSMQDFPRADGEVKELADAMWGDINGKTVTEHAFGQGRVFWGKPLPDILAALRLAPDFAVTGASANQVHYIHRVAEGADLYFVATSSQRDQDVRCSFRVIGRQPAFWHPDTGMMEPCPVWRQVGDRTEVPIHFTPSGSVFVVFRGPANGSHLMLVERQGPALAQPKPAELAVVRAVYGVLNPSGNNVDVTRQVQDLVKQGQRHIVANNSLAGDPAANEVKQMRVDYEVNGARQTETVAENEAFDLPAGATIIRAIYGLNPEAVNDEAQTMDLTAKLAGMVQDGQLHVVAGNALAGRDPAVLVPKQLAVDYVLNGAHKSVQVGENQALDLPGDALGRSLPPAYEVQQTAKGRRLLVNAPGRFTLTQANGRQQRLDVAALPLPLAVNGPWQVSFPPHLGAPPSATFERLISWPTATDLGVKYFSGTATYRTNFLVSPDLFKAGRHFSLDLGNVQVIAAPTLNGHALGTLWKPPFRADVTGLLQPGQNTLEVEVTNLWPNRLIGDEQFPEDVQYTAGGNIAEWPQWLLNNTPRPEPRRITFSTWKHWKKGDDLLPSGLLGPVTIETAVEVPVR